MEAEHSFKHILHQQFLQVLWQSKTKHFYMKVCSHNMFHICYIHNQYSWLPVKHLCGWYVVMLYVCWRSTKPQMIVLNSIKEITLTSCVDEGLTKDKMDDSDPETKSWSKVNLILKVSWFFICGLLVVMLQCDWFSCFRAMRCCKYINPKGRWRCPQSLYPWPTALSGHIKYVLHSNSQLYWWSTEH